MDAELPVRRRSGEISRREKRWSMNSQRLEEIVAELMKPISDVRRSFDTDLNALLEEYLTEAGLHALEASEGEEEGEGPGVGGCVAPNFAELALLLQHSASVYGRKVDCLYQHVLSVSDSLQHQAQEVEREEAETGPSGGGKRRRHTSGAGGAGVGFEPIELSPCAACTREAGPARPPPTLPRVYVELEPRTLTAHDRPLTDYKGEPIGLLADFHAAWRLQEGMLVDELEGWDGGGDGGGSRSLRPIPLMELQAAIQAAAPPELPPRPGTPPPPPLLSPPMSPLPECSTPQPLCASTPLQMLPVKKERKRKSEAKIEDLMSGSFKILINKKVRRRLQKLQEFSLQESWVKEVVELRSRHILRHRWLCPQHCTEFRGFESLQKDVGGFPGWSSSEAAEAHAAATIIAGAAAIVTGAATIPAGADADSDDDGFFEQSSLGDSDASRVDDHITPTNTSSSSFGDSSSWQAEILSRAEANAARGLDVRAFASRVMGSLPSAPQTSAPLHSVLKGAADTHEVAGLFLATLFLANAGNVEIIQGGPLTLNSFSVRLLSTDERLYCAAAAADIAALAEPHR
ncbi:hypothetical protein evm_011702 [Chilo suppressalis]|nr:hypothetical protein evm_011702 [Chilo suppressalis]